MRIRFLQAVEVIVDPWHSACRPGKSVLRIKDTGRIIDAAILREDPNSRIITDDAQAVCRTMEIPFPDVQIIQEQ